VKIEREVYEEIFQKVLPDGLWTLILSGFIHDRGYNKPGIMEFAQK